MSICQTNFFSFISFWFHFPFTFYFYFFHHITLYLLIFIYNYFFILYFFFYLNVPFKADFIIPLSLNISYRTSGGEKNSLCTVHHVHLIKNLYYNINGMSTPLHTHAWINELCYAWLKNIFNIRFIKINVIKSTIIYL